MVAALHGVAASTHEAKDQLPGECATSVSGLCSARLSMGLSFLADVIKLVKTVLKRVCLLVVALGQDVVTDFFIVPAVMGVHHFTSEAWTSSSSATSRQADPLQGMHPWSAGMLLSATPGCSLFFLAASGENGNRFVHLVLVRPIQLSVSTRSALSADSSQATHAAVQQIYR